MLSSGPQPGTYTLAWDPPTNETVMEYHVISIGAEGEITPLFRVAGSSNQALLRGLNPAIGYSLALVSVDTRGRESAPSNSVLTVGAPTATPIPTPTLPVPFNGATGAPGGPGGYYSGNNYNQGYRPLVPPPPPTATPYVPPTYSQPAPVYTPPLTSSSSTGNVPATSTPVPTPNNPISSKDSSSGGPLGSSSTQNTSSSNQNNPVASKDGPISGGTATPTPTPTATPTGNTSGPQNKS